MADARKDKRTLLSLKIRYKSATLEDFIERYSNDISRGGIFIKAKKPLAVGTLLKFEFILQDQSTLIHGVGRVVWRREDAEVDAENPSGMGIKFIKMDPESRSVVERIAEGRGHPGVFEQGKDGVRLTPAIDSDPSEAAEADRTKVRHVSEFLASALDEGGAGEAAKREAQAGAERARQSSNQIGDNRAAAARGAFSARQELAADKRHAVADPPSRGAMSAFGGSGLSASAGMGSAAAPAMSELDAEDDSFDDETTKIHDLPESDYPADADATVIASEASSPFIAEQRLTPVVPASSPLAAAVPDLFGPSPGESFGPAPGEFIDPRLLDPAVPTVPPPAASVPDAPGIPAEALKVPKAGTPAWTTRPTKPKRSRGWMLVLLFVLVVTAGAGGAWQLGFADGLIALAAPYLGQSEELVEVPSQVVQPVAVPTAQPEEPSVQAQSGEEVAAAAQAEPSEPAPAQEAPTEATDADIVKFQVLSRPSGAFVSVNGKAAGRTPLELEYEVGTKLSLFSKARGHLARRHQLTVGADQKPVNLWLARLPYVVQVVTNPAGARASSVGGGEVTTPGALQFKSMSGSRKIVVAKDGYETASRSLTRGDFTEETRRMAATVTLTLQSDGAADPAPAASTTEAKPPAETPPTEATPEPAAAPKAVEEPAVEEPAVEETPAPSETTAADAP
jgi:uncharacterized protein (TIGR02266 family)